MNRDTINTIMLRPAYNSNALLIEFHLHDNVVEFMRKLEDVLEPFEWKINSQEILTDQLLYKGSCIFGMFELDIDNYNFAFIRSEKQSLIQNLYEVLKEAPHFSITTTR